MTELAALKICSAALGANSELVQAAGGNTSLKQGGTMWIKASGTWLREAMNKDIFVGLDHAAIMRALEANSPEAESCAAFVRPECQSMGLRPSIETTVHAAMPQAVVLHVHCVNTIAHAIKANAERELADRLKDFNYAFVAYARPGLPLAGNIAKVMRPGVNVLILQNHGLVVAAETVPAAEVLLHAVVAALAITPRPVMKADLPALRAAIANTDYALPEDETIHAIALDPFIRDVGASAVYYPDHVIFLGAKIATNLKEGAALVALPNLGVAIHKTAKPAVAAMARCLVDVFQRLTPGTQLRALTADDLDRLLNWDAEKYRQKL